MAEHPNDLKTAKNGGNRGEIGYFALAALPVAIYVLAMIIFEQGDFGSLALESKLAAIAHAQKINTALELFTEGRLRILWLSSVLLYYILAIAVVVVCGLTLRNSLTPKCFKQALVLWAGLSCIEIGHFGYATSHDMAIGSIFRFTFESLQSSHFYQPLQLAHIRNMVYLVNLMAAIAPFAVALAAAASLAPLDITDPHQFLRQLMDRSHQLKTVVNLGSAFLVAGVLHMQSWLRWPVVFVDDAKLAGAMNDWSLALTTFVGGVFSLMIACIYICCAKLLAKRAKANLRHLPEDAFDSTLEDWLEKHGFSAEPALHIPQLLAILAPLLAGPVGAVVTGLGNSVGH
ncbi:MAG: hypothetical protein ACXV7F_02300 [Methylomonas sp.]